MSYYDNNDFYMERVLGNDNNMTRTDSNISDNIAFNNEEDDLFIMENEIVEEPKVAYCGISSDTQLSAIINLISSAIGGGCFNFPEIIKNIGLPLTIVIFLFVTVCVYYTIDLLRYFVVDTKLFSFALMTNEILGKNWLKIYIISSLIFYISIEINYFYMIYTIISQMIDLNGDNRLISNIIYFCITIPIEIFICSFIAKIKRVHIFSLISSFLFIILLFIILSQGVKNMIQGTDKFNKDILITPPINNKLEYVLSIATFIIEYLYGYSYHSSYPSLLKNLKTVDNQNTKTVHNISFIYIFVSYFLITFFGFFTIHPVIDIIEKPIGKTIIVIIVFRIYLCLFLFSVVPLRFLVIRDNYTSLIKRNDSTITISFKKDLLYVSQIIILCNIFAFLTNKNIIGFNFATTIIKLFGGIFGVIIGFVLPVINYIGVNRKRKVKSIIGYIVTAIFCVIGIISVGYSFYDIRKKNSS